MLRLGKGYSGTNCKSLRWCTEHGCCRDAHCTCLPCAVSRSMVVKIIPIEGQRQVNGYPQRKAGDMTGEALVSLAVSGLRRAQDAGEVQVQPGLSGGV